MKQDVKRHDDLVAEAEVCLVAVDMKGKPTKIPEELKNFLKKLINFILYF